MDLSSLYVHFGALFIPMSAFPEVAAELSLRSDTIKMLLRFEMMRHIDDNSATSLRDLAKELGCHDSYVDHMIRYDDVCNVFYEVLQAEGLMK